MPPQLDWVKVEDWAAKDSGWTTPAPSCLVGASAPRVTWGLLDGDGVGKGVMGDTDLGSGAGGFGRHCCDVMWLVML